MSIHSYIVISSWVQCACYRVPPPFYNKSRDTTSHRPHPTPFICLPADDPPVLFSPHIHLNVNMHKNVRHSLPPSKYTHNRCPYLSPTPPPKNKSLAHQYAPTAAITLLLYTIITIVLQIL